jgi:hypothetical protein
VRLVVNTIIVPDDFDWVSAFNVVVPFFLLERGSVKPGTRPGRPANASTTNCQCRKKWYEIAELEAAKAKPVDESQLHHLSMLD